MGNLIRCAIHPIAASPTAPDNSANGTPIPWAIIPHAKLPAAMAPLNTVRYTARERPRTQLGRIAWATPLSVVNAVIQAAPRINREDTASHLGGARVSKAMTAEVTNADARSRPSALRYIRKRGIITAPPIAPKPTAPSNMP